MPCAFSLALKPFVWRSREHWRSCGDRWTSDSAKAFFTISAHKKGLCSLNPIIIAVVMVLITRVIVVTRIVAILVVLFTYSIQASSCLGVRA